jgi:hypothetical protein
MVANLQKRWFITAQHVFHPNKTGNFWKTRLAQNCSIKTEIAMENKKQDVSKEKETIDEAVQNVNENKHQDLSKENLGIEPEEQPEGDPNNPYRLEGFDDKRPESDEIEKGWTVDSNTGRGVDDISRKDSE